MREWKLNLLRIPVVVLSAMTLAACGGGEDAEPEPGDAGQPAQADSARVAFNWSTPLPDWTGPLLAREQGLYQDENLDLDFQFVRGSALSVQGVGSGDSQIGFAGAETFLNGVSEGLPLIAIGALFQTAPTGVIAFSEKGFSSLADLQGESISTAQESPEPALLLGQLAALGIERDDVNLVNVDPQAKCTVMLAGRTDACTGFDNFQLVTARLEGHEVDFIPFSTEERPILGHVIFTTEDFAEENPDVLERFLLVTCQGYKAAEENPDELVSLWQSDILPEDDPEYVRMAMEASHSHLVGPATEEHGWGWMETRPFEVLQELLVDGEILKAPVPIEDVFTNEFLPGREACDFG